MLKLEQEAKKYFKTNLELQITPQEEESTQEEVGFVNNLLLKEK